MVIKQNLINNCRNLIAIFYLQTMLYLKPICFVILFVFSSSLHAQDNALVVKTPQNLYDVLERKLSLDKKRLAKTSTPFKFFLGITRMQKSIWTLFRMPFQVAMPNSLLKLRTTKSVLVNSRHVWKESKRLIHYG